MSDSWYFFYQREAKSSWTLSLASERDNINSTIKPELNTILDVNSAMEGDITLEDKDKLRYRGPMYFDFDSEDLDEVIPQFQQFLTNLKAINVNLNALRLYCSGGKGFHIEMPAVMLGKMPNTGLPALPLVYHEVAHELYVNTLDMRVYSTGKGRQWRCPNIKRANGKHKVQITVDEAWEMTPEMYADLVKYPRPLFPTEEANFNAGMGLIFAKARDKVDHGIKNRKNRKKTVDELKRFKGEWPETLRTILSGQGLKDNIGWNFLAVQLAISAVSLGKTEEQFIKDAEPLVHAYQGDSGRYGSVVLRNMELRDKHRYFTNSVCYEFSVGGVLSLVQPAVVAASDLNLGEYEPDGNEEADKAEGEEEVTTSVRVNSNGMYSKTDNGWKNISHIGISDPVLLVIPEGGRQIGYDIELNINGKPKGRQLLNLQALATKASFHNYAMTFNASFRGTDMDAAHIVDLLRVRVESKAKIALVTQVEGIDLILPPGSTSEDDLEVIWSSPTGVVSTGKHQYTFRPLASSSGTYKTDLYNAPELSNCQEDREMIRDMLAFNTPQNLARLLGWYGATFLCPILRRYYSQFPLLQVYGGASAGKSKSIALLSHLHYHLHKPKIVQSSGLTQYPLLVAASSSSSIPLVLEELRYKFLRTGGKYEMLTNLLKSNFDGHGMERGALGDKGSGAVVNEFANTAPIVFTAEEKNGEVAIQERSVSVCMGQADRLGRDAPYARLLAKSTHLGRLGKSMVVNALSVDIPGVRGEFDVIHDRVKASMGKEADGKDRPIYNLAVTLMGLKFMQGAIQRVFGSEFDEQFEIMDEAIMGNVIEFVPQNMSESAKVLDTMAQMSKLLDVSVRLEHGREYCVNGAARTVDIKLKPAYAKYMRYVRSLGSAPLFESDTSFIAAMNRYDGVVQRSGNDSPLFDNPFEAIFRFSIDALQKDHIEPFKD